MHLEEDMTEFGIKVRRMEKGSPSLAKRQALLARARERLPFFILLTSCQVPSYLPQGVPPNPSLAPPPSNPYKKMGVRVRGQEKD